MKTAFVIFDGLTTLDFVGVYDPVTRLKTMDFIPGMEWEICAFTKEVRDDKGLRLQPTRVGQPLGGFDLLIVPGGFSTRPLVKDKAFVDWIRTAASCPVKASVCTGALLLGAAGFLAGRRATTHPNAFDALRPYCAEVRDERVVDEGDVITARGVTSGIDLGLHLCRRLAGPEATAKIKRQMDYPYGE
ncbi:MAG: DJ-1/PfpI family protein [SAR324 cluster bacterium]|nr:DJ-1/PfpI family protein [SAR324 cluster bacterium]